MIKLILLLYLQLQEHCLFKMTRDIQVTEKCPVHVYSHS